MHRPRVLSYLTRFSQSEHKRVNIQLYASRDILYSNQVLHSTISDAVNYADTAHRLNSNRKKVESLYKDDARAWTGLFLTGHELCSYVFQCNFRQMASAKKQRVAATSSFICCGNEFTIVESLSYLRVVVI